MSEQTKEKKMVEIPEETLKEILAKLERLEFASSKKNLALYDTRFQKNKSKVVRLRMLDGKVILSWDKMPKDFVEKDSQGYWREEQLVKIHFEDETEEVMELVKLSRRYEGLPAIVTKETILSEEEEIKKYGERLLEVKTDDGRVYKIGVLFIN